MHVGARIQQGDHQNAQLRMPIVELPDFGGNALVPQLQIHNQHIGHRDLEVGIQISNGLKNALHVEIWI